VTEPKKIGREHQDRQTDTQREKDSIGIRQTDKKYINPQREKTDLTRIATRQVSASVTDVTATEYIKRGEQPSHRHRSTRQRARYAASVSIAIGIGIASSISVSKGHRTDGRNCEHIVSRESYQTSGIASYATAILSRITYSRYMECILF
jgi:hypothetical protein